MRAALTSIAILAVASVSHAGIYITEWMYDGTLNGEFVEFTNVGPTPINMTGWSYDDDSRIPGEFDLSGFGTVLPGESVLITEDTASAFRTKWSLPASVKVLGGVTNNLGRNDEINLFDADGNLVDRLTYGDNTYAPGSIRTQRFSGNPSTPAALGANDVWQWQLSFVGDSFGSYTSTAGNVGNPGVYIPEPATLVLMALGVAALLRRR